MSRLFTLEHAADTDDWYTPPWIFEHMAERFDLDVCTPLGGVPWIPADRYFTEADDGLVQVWNGFVWCNPPYSAPLAWCDKWAAHQNGIIVLRADLSTRGPATALMASTSMFVPTPRLQFVNGHGEKPGAVNFSTVLLGAGDRADTALAKLSERGVVRRWEVSGDFFESMRLTLLARWVPCVVTRIKRVNMTDGAILWLTRRLRPYVVKCSIT